MVLYCFTYSLHSKCYITLAFAPLLSHAISMKTLENEWHGLSIKPLTESRADFKQVTWTPRKVGQPWIASYPGRVGGERRPGTDCLLMRDHSQKTWKPVYVRKLSVKLICIRLMYFPCHWKIQPFASWITFNSKNVEDSHRVYESKDAFLWLPTSFGKSVCYEVLSFACLTVTKARHFQGRVAMPLSC